MPDEKRATPPPKVKVVWGDATQLEPVLVDELNVLQVNDRVYITFGQVRLPLIQDPAPAEVVAQIVPVVRLATTKDTWAKMLEAMNRTKSRTGSTRK